MCIARIFCYSNLIGNQYVYTQKDPLLRIPTILRVVLFSNLDNFANITL